MFDFDIMDLQGPGATVGIMDYSHHNEGIVGGGLLRMNFISCRMLFRVTGRLSLPVGDWNIRNSNGRIITGSMFPGTDTRDS